MKRPSNREAIYDGEGLQCARNLMYTNVFYVAVFEWRITTTRNCDDQLTLRSSSVGDHPRCRRSLEAVIFYTFEFKIPTNAIAS